MKNLSFKTVISNSKHGILRVFLEISLATFLTLSVAAGPNVDHFNNGLNEWTINHRVKKRDKWQGSTKVLLLSLSDKPNFPHLVKQIRIFNLLMTNRNTPFLNEFKQEQTRWKNVLSRTPYKFLTIITLMIKYVL